MLIEISQPLNYLSLQISRSFVTQEQSFLVIMVSLTAHTKAISSNMAVGGLVLRHIKTNKRKNNNNTATLLLLKYAHLPKDSTWKSLL